MKLFEYCSICHKTIWFGFDMMTSKLYHNIDHGGPPTKNDKPSTTYYYHRNCELGRLIEENAELSNKIQDLQFKLQKEIKNRE